MTTQSDQDKTIHCKEFKDLMTEFRNADYSNVNPLDAYDAVVAYVNEKRPPLPSPDQMTLRDQFAMAAMQEFMRNSFVMQDFIPKDVAELSFKMADSMLRARKPK
jgi:hypothetical protein